MAGAFFGRRTVGRFNATRRDDLRRGQLRAVAPYEHIKGVIDQILYQLDTVKGQIELSPEYLNKAYHAKPAIVTEIASPPRLPPPPPSLAAPSLPRFYVYMAGEVKGPYSIEQLHALRDAAAIADDALCCADGSQEWLPYRDIKN